MKRRLDTEIQANTTRGDSELTKNPAMLGLAMQFLPLFTALACRSVRELAITKYMYVGPFPYQVCLLEDYHLKGKTTPFYFLLQ